MPDLKRLERLVEILRIIDQGETVTPKGLAAHFGITDRTIYRDILILQTDFPIAFDYERNSYCFSEGYSLKKIDLSLGPNCEVLSPPEFKKRCWRS